jgi:O-antigen/teichoic acid export membrane protein
MSNLLWKFAERITAQLVTLVVSIILARLLEPSHYGIISIVTIFITIANVFVSDGFGSALIQKKDADSLDFYSVLFFNIGFSCVLYGILFVTAPFISVFYGDGYEILTPVLRVLSLRLILSAVNSVQQAYVSKQMMFRKFFWSTLFGTIASAVVGIFLAYKGFGVWALVAQYLTNTTVDTIVLNRTMHFEIKFIFSFKRLKTLIPYGAGILGTQLLITGYQELRALLIGKIYSSADLAYYDKGKQFPDLIVTNINSSVGAVLFPKMSMEQDDPIRIKATTRMSIRFSAFVMCPLMLGMAAVAGPFVRIVLTDKWLQCVPLLQMFCIVYLFQPIHTANMQAIKAIGRSDIYLKLEIAKKIIELVSLIAVMRISVDAIVISMAVLTAAFTFVNSIPNSKLLDYKFSEQMRDILPCISMSLVMAGIVYVMGNISIPQLPLFLIQVFSGGFIYLVLAIMTKNREFSYIYNLLKSKIDK